MAIKTSWAAGDVLAAADLTDTFAAKAPSASPAFTGSPTLGGVAWGLPGLSFISVTAISAASSTVVNSCFTSAFDNYRIMVRFTNSGNANNCLRLRASGTDNTAAAYSHNGPYANNAGAVAGYGISAATTWTFSVTNTNTSHLVVFDLCGPALAAVTSGTIQGTEWASTTAATYSGGLWHSAASAFDGFDLYADAGTMTGTLYLFGYRKV